MRYLQRLHQNVRGWADIGYHRVVFQPYGRLHRARVFEGRRLEWVPAAQGGHNSNTMAVCVVMAEGEKLRWATRRKLRRIVATAPPGVTKVRGHYEVTQTSCPGSALKAYLPALNRVLKRVRS